MGAGFSTEGHNFARNHTGWDETVDAGMGNPAILHRRAQAEGEARSGLARMAAQVKASLTIQSQAPYQDAQTAPMSSPRLATYFHVHLVSDATGETLNVITRSVCARLNDVLPIEHIYGLVRTEAQLETALDEIAKAPGVVLHTMVDKALCRRLEAKCAEIGVPCIAAIDPIMQALSLHLGAEISTRVGAQYDMESDYQQRMDALNYALGHDDGLAVHDFSRAHVVLVGVSRTSKTPTSIYLAHRGVRAANVPLVPGAEPPPELVGLAGIPVVALTIAPDRLVEIRYNRLKSLNETRPQSYADLDSVRAEIIAARRLFDRMGWPVIDVTRRSVEETAAAVINIISGGRGQVGVLG